MRILSAAVLILATAVGMATAPKPTATLSLNSSSAAKGAQVKGTVTIKVPAGYHIYQNPPTKEYQIPLKIVAADSGVTVVKVEYPKGKDYTDGAGDTFKIYDGTIKVPVTLKMPSSTGKKTLKVKVNYQMCDDSACLPPDNVVASAAMTIKARVKAAFSFLR